MTKQSKALDNEAPDFDELNPGQYEAAFNSADDSDDSPIQYQEDELYKLLVDLGGETDAEMRIYKQPGRGNAKLAYIFTCAPGDYSYGELLDRIKREYGGGEYRMHVRQDKRLIINRQFSVAEAIDNNASADKNMELMQSRFENKLEKMQSDNMRMFERLIDNLSHSEKGPSGLEMQQNMFSMMLQAKELFSESVPKSNPIKDLKELMEFQNQMRESMPSDREPGSADILINALSQFGPAFKQLLDKNQGQQGMPGMPPQNPNVPLPSPNPEPQQNHAGNHAGNGAQKPQDNPELENMKPFLQHIQVLFLAASQNADPVTYANVIIDFADDSQLEMLQEFLTPDNAIEKIPANFPATKQYFDNPETLAWFHELRRELLSLLADTGNDYPDLPDNPEPAISESEQREQGENDHGHVDGDS